MGIRARVILTLLTVFFYAVPALALRVVVVEPSSDDAPLFEAFGRLRAELELQGFEVSVISGRGEAVDTDALEVEARNQSAIAAVALQREGDGTTAEIRIVDRVTGKTVTRKLKISKAKDGPLLLAIRAADLLRASLLELSPGESPPDDVVGTENRPPPSEVVRFSRELPRLQIGAGALALFHPELGPSFGGSLAIAYRPLPRLALRLEVGGPAFGGEYSAGEDSASVREEFALAGIAYNLGKSEPGARWEWGPALGLGGVHVAARGNVAPPLVSKSAELWALGLQGGAFVEAYFNDTVSAGLSVGALGLIPQPVIAIDEEQSVPLGVSGYGTLRLGVSF